MNINEFFDDVVRYVTCQLDGYDLMKIFKVDSMQFEKYLYPENFNWILLQLVFSGNSILLPWNFII